MDPMLYDKSSFTHILCAYFTIYEIEDVTTFFRHCYYWLKPGGYLIVHLVEPDRFANTHTLKKNRRRSTSSKQRMTQWMIDQPNYHYTSSYESSGESVKFKEQFLDKKNKNVRENEHILRMPSIESILHIVKQNGFIVHSKANLESYNGDEHQYLYIFERIQGNLLL